MAKAYYASAISPRRAKTPEGYLIVLGNPVARTGLQQYRAGEMGIPGVPSDQIIEVYRSEAEVFSTATLASFEGKSVTSPHPPKFLSPQNDTGYSRGHVQNVRRGDTLENGEQSLIADFVIKDAMLIDQIENGKLKEVSAGYSCEYWPREGAANQYDQTTIRGNHVAIVPFGRAGSSVRIMDSKEDERKSLMEKGFFTEMLEDLGWKKPSTEVVADSDPGAVERNMQVHNEALLRARRRNEDAMTAEEKVEMEKKDKETKDQHEKLEKKVNDTASSVDEIKTAQNDQKSILAKIQDALEDLKAKKEEKESKDSKDSKDAKTKDAKAADQDEKEKKEKESEDADLIPVETLSSEDIPKNPLHDALLPELLKLKPFIAKSGTREAKDAWNKAFKALKGTPAEDGAEYSHLVSGEKPDKVKRAEEMSSVHAQDASQSSTNFVDMAKKFHRKNPGEVDLSVKPN